ncbi:hypothetical protein H310_00899 [Aphanomyces invadans]|uniref:Vacuolar ATPase assembly protein VMA22 n=1 Tax=Aphanomyces invadans TaxID=157072 RepID=A0A024UQZ1_9STRA|nr:hypothetical protein H310_00899 [Aphanomyces invadans]ETW08272.1 hypothetical protein H310_00899 [Aphanomyces invadans]|eukprot:XP_008862077.1 hypothetical protein H310_00899 [Aphanomyces invadans]
MDKDLDALLLTSLDATAQYSRATLEASNTLRAAFFKLSAAKRSVATDVLSSFSFKETFDATTGVTVADEAYRVRKDWNQEQDAILQHEKRAAETTSSLSTEAALRHRKQKQAPATSQVDSTVDAVATTTTQSTLPTPIFWFAPMPSQDLRAAQAQFSQVLEQYIQTATLARQVTDAVRAVRHTSHK